MESLCARGGKKRKNFILGHFYVILNLKVGRKSMSLPVSNTFKPEGDAGHTEAYTMLILRYPKSMGEDEL
jgi:hypothetical protein